MLAVVGAVPVVDVEAVPAVIEQADVVVVEQAVDVAAGVEADAPAVVDGLPDRQAVCMTGKCGSTTAYIVLHNSMDYYKLDIGSFLFLHPLKWVNSKNNTSIKT